MIACAAAGLVVWLVAPQVYAVFPAVRVKVVQTALASASGRLEVPVPATAGLDRLGAPLGAILRLRNDSETPVDVQAFVDGRAACSATIPAHASRRVDCAIRDGWIRKGLHNVTIASAGPLFTLEYLELATHYGALTAGPRNLIVVPRGSAAFERPGAWRLFIVGTLLALAIGATFQRRLPKVLWAIHLAFGGLVGVVLVLAIALRFFSPYSLVLQDAFLARLFLLGTLPLFAGRAGRRLAWLHLSKIPPLARLAVVGLLVGVVFASYARTRAEQYHGGNPSGLLLVEQDRFDSHPILSKRDDIRRSLWLTPNVGYDGEFFYFMTFDPFLQMFRSHPERYKEFIDFPPYRYGRIGFSVLTKVASGNRPTRYPITMVALVVGALGVSAALLGALAARRGLSAWYGALILFVPGFWQSVECALPEPLAIAFILGGCLLAQQERWWACGVSLALSLLVRETSGALVLALPAGLLLTGRRRESLLLAALTFAPLLAWKLFVGSVFYGEFGMDAFFPHPADFGPPFAGAWHMWMKVADGTYFAGMSEMSRAGVLFPLLTTSAVALAVAFFISSPSPVSAAAVIYALLTIHFNYEAVWLHIANAQRLTIDLFVALTLVFVQQSTEHRALAGPFTVFWFLSGLYVFFGTYEAGAIRHGAIDWIGRLLGWS